MSLIQEKFSTFLDFEDLAINPSEIFSSELLSFNNLSPEKAFSKGEMVKFKNNIKENLDSYGDELPEELSSLNSTINSITPEELSSVLFFGGVSVYTFSADGFDYSLENLVQITSYVMAFGALIQGGCEILRSAIQTIKSLNDVSLGDMDISSAIESFAVGVVREIKSLITATIDGVVEIAKNIIESVEEQIERLRDLLDQITDITLDDIQNFLAESAELLYNSVVNAVKTLISGIENALSTLVNITSQCIGFTSSHNKEIEKSLVKNANDIDAVLPEVPKKTTDQIRKDLIKSIERNNQYYSERNGSFKTVQTAAFIKKFKQNNPDASDEEIHNATQFFIAKANEENDMMINRKIERERKKTNRVPAIVADITKKAKDNESESVLAGRKSPDKAELKMKANIHLEKNKFYDESYFGGKYARQIATKINDLHHTVRHRFADGMRDLTTNEDLIAAKIEFTISSSFRSLEKQRELYRIYAGKSPVAFPGNSWHNYGVAADLTAFVNGVAKGKKSGWYKTLPRQFLAKYDLVNPFKNDYIHFQPSEIPLNPRGLKSTLIASNGQVNDNALNNLIG